MSNEGVDEDEEQHSVGLFFAEQVGTSCTHYFSYESNGIHSIAIPGNKNLLLVVSLDREGRPTLNVVLQTSTDKPYSFYQ